MMITIVMKMIMMMMQCSVEKGDDYDDDGNYDDNGVDWRKG